MKKILVIFFLITTAWAQLLKGTGLELDDISDFVVLCESFDQVGKRTGFTADNVESIAKQFLSSNGTPSKPIDDVSPILLLNIIVMENKSNRGAILGYNISVNLSFNRYVKYSNSNGEYVNLARTWQTPTISISRGYSEEALDRTREIIIKFLEEFSTELLKANGKNTLPKKQVTKKDLYSQFEKPIINKNFSSSASPSAASSYSRVIEGRIDGDFEGWEGETIIKLMDGGIWQQTEYYYYYHYAYSPKVTIVKSGSSYKMKVDGVSKAVGVEKLN